MTRPVFLDSCSVLQINANYFGFFVSGYKKDNIQAEVKENASIAKV